MIGARALLAAALLLWTSGAAASEVVLVSNAGEVFDRRVEAEVRSVGLDVRRAAALPDPSKEQPAGEQALAWVKVDADAGLVEVWMLEAGRALHLGSVKLRTKADDSLRVAERVRALLQPVVAKVQPPQPKQTEPAAPVPTSPDPKAPEPNASDPSATEPTPQPKGAVPRPGGAGTTQPATVQLPSTQPPLSPVPPSPGASSAASSRGSPAGAARDGDAAETKRWAIELAPAYVRQTTAPALSLLLRGRWRFADAWSVELLGLLPLVASDVSLPPDSAQLDARLVGAGMVWHALGDSDAEPPAVQLRFGAGISAAFVEARGSAGPGAVSRDTATVTAVPYAGFTASFALHRNFAISAGGLAGVSIRRTEILFRNEQVTTWGWPLVVGSVGLEAMF